MMKIKHPRLEGYNLNYVSPFGPENNVYVRGRIKNKIIQLPPLWEDFVNLNNLTIHLTEIGSKQDVFVKGIQGTEIHLQTNGMPVDCYYLIFGERTDIPRHRPEQREVPLDAEDQN
jgi:hypothetical protein